MAAKAASPIRLARHVLLALGLALLAVAATAATTPHPVHAGSPPNRLDPPVSPAGVPSSTLTVHALLWDSNWDADNPTIKQATIDDFVGKLVASPYMAKLAQYGVTSYSYTGSDLPASGCSQSAPAPSFSYFDLSGWVLCEKHNLPNDRIGGVTVWLVVPPSGTGQSGSCIDGGGWSGYHFDTLPSIIPPDIPQTFALVTPGCDSSLDAVTAEASHELVEAAIDPLPGLGWIDHSTAGFLGLDFGSLYTKGEASDICDSIGPAGPPLSTLGRIGGGLYAVDYYWSNADNACVPMPDNVTLTATGAPSSLLAQFDGGSVSLPFTTTVADGTTHDVEFPSPFAAGPGSRYVTSFSSGNQLVTADTTFTAAYTHQYLLQTAVSGYPATPAQVGLPPSGWVDAGSTVNIAASPLVSVPPDRIRFDHWEGDAGGGSPNLSFAINGPMTIIANYVLQHLVTFNAGGIPAAVPWQVTVNGVAQSGPFSDWFDDASTVAFAFQTPVSGSGGTRYVLASTSTTSPLTVTSPATVTGVYGTQRLLTVQTSGLGSNQSRVYNGGVLLGQATDATPLTVWMADGSALTLSVDSAVSGASGTQYFFQSFSPAVPATLTAPFTTTASYATMASVLAGGLSGGGISGPGAAGLTNSYQQQFAAVQTDFAGGSYATALDDLTSFISHVAAQSGKKVSPPLAVQLQLAGLADYHNALCLAQTAGQLSSAQAAADTTYYTNQVTALGGTPIDHC